jgi:hypothetical protein
MRHLVRWEPIANGFDLLCQRARMLAQTMTLERAGSGPAQQGIFDRDVGPANRTGTASSL